jgi:hypothetical protein
MRRLKKIVYLSLTLFVPSTNEDVLCHTNCDKLLSARRFYLVRVGSVIGLAVVIVIVFHGFGCAIILHHVHGDNAADQ